MNQGPKYNLQADVFPENYYDI